MITLVVGMPRSGKSTWIINNKDKNDIVISNDWIRENILGNQYSDAANPVIWTITDSCIRILLSQGVNVILDGINHTRYIRKLFLDIGKEYATETRIVYIDTPLAVCLERNKTNTKLPPEKLIKMQGDLEVPTMYECDHFVRVQFENPKLKPDEKIVEKPSSFDWKKLFWFL